MRKDISVPIYKIKNDIRQIYCYRLNQVTNTLFGKSYKPNYKRFCGREVMALEKANEYISELIDSNKPFWVGRYGHTELGFLASYLWNESCRKDGQLEGWFKSLQNNAGFFPNDYTLGSKYADLIFSCCGEMDLHGIWPLYMEDYFISKYEKDTKLMHYVCLEPWALQKGESGILPWSHSLKGKKVLVIHPFEETIKKQYEEKRERIFERIYPNADDILPKFELKTLKAVQTIAGNRDQRFLTWFEALNWMKTECEKIDFDIAILGCGAYGFPLAAEIKKMGKGAIQICGATQLMFGIIGNRWENNQRIMGEIVNDAWVHPSLEECVKDGIKVENSCYW